MYEVGSPLKSAAFGAFGNKYANSPLKDRLEGASVSMFGNLFTNLVKKGTSVEKLVFKPTIVLFTDS
jgi:hypothetical protein